MSVERRVPFHSLGLADLRECYRQMVSIRLFECLAEEAAAAGHIRGMIHSAVGQEAIAVGTCFHLHKDDLITSTHRNHHHALAKGVPVGAAMAELFGRVTGSCGGKGGSMHIADFSVGMMGANGVVGASVVISAGIAQALRYRKSDAVAVAFIGDGALNRGQCLEAMNYAAVYRLPLLIVCEDNGWAATTPSASVTAGPGAVHRAAALGLRAAEADGNDVEAVAAAAGKAIRSVRLGEGPGFLLCRTYRVRGHTCADPAKYRDPVRHVQYLTQDPISRCRQKLLDHGLARIELDDMDAAIRLTVARAVDDALAAPSPEQAAALQDIQTAGATPCRS